MKPKQVFYIIVIVVCALNAFLSGWVFLLLHDAGHLLWVASSIVSIVLCVRRMQGEPPPSPPSRVYQLADVKVLGVTPDAQFDNAQSHYRQGNICFANGDLSGAIDFYDQAIRLNANAADAYLSRAFAYDRKGDKRSAIADFHRFIALEPDHIATSDALAYIAKYDLSR